MQRILVLRGGALGDFIVTLPALALLRQRWPEAGIELVGNATAAALARARGLLDAVHSQHDARWAALFGAGPLPGELAGWLRGFDLVLNFWPDVDGSLARHFPVRPGQTFLTAPAMPTRAPAAAHYCEPLRSLGLSTTEFVFRLGSPAAGATRIALHPGSGSPRKNWPVDRWRELMDTLDAPLLLILGEAEEKWSRCAPAGSGRDIRVASQLPLESLVAEFAQCRLFIGHDSGISHLAAGCGVPSLLLFGPTDPALWAPPSPKVRVIQRGSDLAAISVAEVRSAIP